MRVTRIEIFGFKSFLEKLVLPLEAGFTGVVGPNGCGKSNIVDAIRWILGETRASQLRGGTLEDVIFNGTDKLRPLGLAEVTLTLRSAESDFFSEIVSSITRQGNQFAATLAALNSTQESLSEETSSEEGVTSSEDSMIRGAVAEGGLADGAPRLTVISGSLGASAEATWGAAASGAGGGSGHRLHVLDGGAEIAHHADLEPAIELQDIELEGGVENSEAASAVPAEGSVAEQADEEYARHALQRFGWLRNVQEVQITRRLYRSGESEFFINRVACRLKDIKELFRIAGLGARAYTIVAQGEVGRIVTSRPEERRLIIEEAAGVAGFREKIGAASRRLEETTQNLTRLDDVAREVQRQVNSLRVQAGRAKARQELKDRVVELEQILFASQLMELSHRRDERTRRSHEVQEHEQRARIACEVAQAAEQEARGSALATDVEGDDVRRRIDAITDELRRRSEERSECAARVTQVSAQLEASRGQLKSLEDRVQMLIERRSEAERTVGDLEAKDADLVQQLSAMGNQVDDLVRELSAKLASLREDLRSKEGLFRSTRDKLVSSESRLLALLEQIEATSPVAQMKDVIGRKDHGNIFSAALNPTHEGSAESVEQNPKALFEAFVANLSSGAKLFISGLTIPAHLVRPMQAVLGDRVSYLVTPDYAALTNDYSKVVLGVGAQVDKASERKSARELPALGMLGRGELGEETNHGVRSEGEMPFPRLLDLIQVDAGHRAAAEVLLGQVYLVSSAVEAMAFLESSRGDLTVVTTHGEVLTRGSYFYPGRTERGVLHLQQEAQALRTQIETLKAEHSEVAETRERIQQEIADTDRRHGEALSEMRRQQARARELSNQQGSIRGRLHAEKRVLAQLEQDIGKAEQGISECASTIGRRELELADRNKVLAELESSLDLAGRAQDLTAELHGLRARWTEIEARRSEGRDALGRIAQQLQLARNEVERARAEVSRAELELEKSSLEAQALREKVVSEYGEEFFADKVTSMAEDFLQQAPANSEIVSHRDEVQKIRARIAREGEVDSSSIQRFDEEQARLVELNAQKDDLSAAAKTLQRTIEKLRETSEVRFLSTFKAVRNNFSRLVPRLFGGGKASLELTDPAKPLECGIEISVRPPGKKLKSIDLMSGGEKALCAIALIVAMFMERPSPLCILDEVDAPLDEANLVRFLSLLKEMSHKTQFVVVTHNKQTMTVADQLIGVTMQQPGASTVVTVSLQEAYQHVA